MHRRRDVRVVYTMMGFWGIVITMASGWYLAGLSWTVLFVVYPAFSHVGAAEWPAYHDAHMRGILPAVGPMWLAEAIGVLMWLAAPPPGTRVLLVLSGFAALATVVLTGGWAVPAHAALAAGYDDAIWQRLQRAHALRTLAWTVAAVCPTLALAVTQTKN